MLLKSNLGAVRARLQRLQSGIPGAVQAACAPGYWTERLREVARATLQAQLAHWGQTVAVEEARAAGVVGQVQAFVASVAGDVELFVDLLRGESTPTGSRFTGVWDTGRRRGVDLAAAGERVQDQADKKSTAQFEFDDVNVARSRAAVEEWVMEEKTLGDEEGFDPEVALERVERILGLRPLSVEELKSDDRRAAAERLQRRIQEYLDRNHGDAPANLLDAATTSQWLQAVVVAWREYVRAHLPERVAGELRKLNRRIAANELF